MTTPRGKRERMKAMGPARAGRALGVAKVISAPRMGSRSRMGMMLDSVMGLGSRVTVDEIEDAEDDGGESGDHSDGIALEQAALGGLEGVACDLGHEAH